ncbi:MAG: hypothetical protein QOF40_2211 [Actinomycetota bacterium]|nr:hypothetical protein [Actinomycetota bacterium]
MRRVALVGFVASLILGVLAVPGTAATKDPCKVLKQREIAKAFGATVGNPKQAGGTAVSADCQWTISGGTAGAGTLTVHVMTIGASPAYAGLQKVSSYVPVAGYPKSLWAEALSVVEVLRGNVLLGVQGGFPDKTSDIQAPLVRLSKIAVKRV